MGSEVASFRRKPESRCARCAGITRFCIKEAGFAMVSVTLEVKAVLTMKLQISYDPESDTLDIGNGLPGNDGQVVADRLTAFFGDGEDTVGVTLENAG